MLGGHSELKNPTEEIQCICNQVKTQVESKTGKKYEVFNAIHYTEQIVSGRNFKIKVHVGGSDYLHLLIYQPLSGELRVKNTEGNKSLEDTL